MKENWDYAKLSKAAKEAGGPEKLVEQIASISKAEGKREGVKSTIPWYALGLIGVSLVTRICDYFVQKKKENRAAFENARQEVINGINEYDATHKDKIDDETEGAEEHE